MNANDRLMKLYENSLELQRANYAAYRLLCAAIELCDEPLPERLLVARHAAQTLVMDACDASISLLESLRNDEVAR